MLLCINGFFLNISHLSIIRVRIFAINSTVVLDILEGIVHEAAVASVVAVLAGAVHQILLGQAHQLAGL